MCRRPTGAIKQGRKDARTDGRANQAHAPSKICLKISKFFSWECEFTSHGVEVHAAEELLLPSPQALVVLQVKRNPQQALLLVKKRT